jgi:hypothetical protein
MDLFIAKFKLIITDLNTKATYTYYLKALQTEEFIQFLEDIRNEKGLEYDSMCIALEVIDKAVAHFD